VNGDARVYYTESQKALMWEHWQKGDTLHQIAQLFDRHHQILGLCFICNTPLIAQTIVCCTDRLKPQR